jgi:hypothetical protein
MVGALLRKAQSEGGFGAVLAKGDPTAGSILVVLAERGENSGLYERILHPDGRYMWRRDPAQDSDALLEVPRFIARRRQFDPDLWVVELDVPSAERFAAEMNGLD